MKKRLMALILIIVLCISLASCGTDYKKLGYNYMKEQMAEEYPDGIDDNMKSSIILGAALLGSDNLYALIGGSVDNISKDDVKEVLNGKDISDDDLEKFKEGCKEYMNEFLAEVIPTTSEQ